MKADSPGSRGELWVGLVLAGPAFAFLLGLALNALVAEPGLMRGAWLEGAVTSGVFGGGLISLVTTPALLFFILVVRRRVSPGVRAWLYAFLGAGLVTMLLVVRYLAGLSDLS